MVWIHCTIKPRSEHYGSERPTRSSLALVWEAVKETPKVQRRWEKSLDFSPLLFLSSIALPTQVVLKPKLLFGRATSPRGWCKTVYFSPLPLSSCYMALEGVEQSKTTVSDQKTKEWKPMGWEVPVILWRRNILGKQ